MLSHIYIFVLIVFLNLLALTLIGCREFEIPASYNNDHTVSVILCVEDSPLGALYKRHRATQEGLRELSY